MTLLKADSLKDAFLHLTSNSLLVIDLDNTLIECKTAFGSYQWCAHLIQESIKNGMGFEQALDLAMPKWEEVQHLIEMQLVEEESSSWLQGLISQGQSVLALTGRPFSLANKTVQDVKNNALEFSSYSFDFCDLEGVHYQDGIVFVGPKQNKGFVLVHGLQQIDHAFDRIIFVDDQKTYVEQVQKAMQGIALDFVGFHFTALDRKVQSFDYSQALKEQAIIQPS